MFDPDVAGRRGGDSLGAPGGNGMSRLSRSRPLLSEPISGLAAARDAARRSRKRASALASGPGSRAPIVCSDGIAAGCSSDVAAAGAASLREASPGEFLAYAARTMRSVVIDLTSERQALRRGGDLDRVTLNISIMESAEADDEPLRVDEALTELAQVEPRLSQVVEMRYFGGFTEAEIGAALGITERTVRRDWEKARLLMRAMLTG